MQIRRQLPPKARKRTTAGQSSSADGLCGVWARAIGRRGRESEGRGVGGSIVGSVDMLW